MRQWWWKILGTALLLYVVIIGLRTPLAPALIHRSIDRIAPGPVSFVVSSYNTRFANDVLQGWIENDSQRVCATNIERLSDDQLRISMDIPTGLRKEMSDLHIFSEHSGALVMYDAFFTEGRGSGIEDRNCAVGKSLRSGFEFPDRNILNESIRNLFFHVPMWFAMITVMSIGVWKSVRVLRANSMAEDRAALAAVQVGLLFGLFGLITGSLWARVTWETWWTIDVKLNGAAVGVLVYLAYLVLRGSVAEPAKRARLAAIYSIFAFTFMLLFFLVLPRLNAVDSLHPGNGGNPAFNTYDLDNRLRLVFYPACAGWIIMGVWMYQLRRRLLNLEDHLAHATDQ